MKLTQWLSISVFVVTCGAIVSLSILGNWDGGEFRKTKPNRPQAAQNQESFFKTVEYYFVKEFKKSLQLNAKELSIDNSTGRTLFLAPRGSAFTSKGEEIHYKGKTGVLKSGKEQLLLEGSVSMKLESSSFESDKLEYTMLTDKLVSIGNVRSYSKSQRTGDEIEIFSNHSVSYPKSEKSRYMGNVRGEIIRKRAYEDNIFFKSKSLDMDLSIHKIYLKENVLIKKQLFEATSYRGEIFLQNYNKRLKYFVLNDDVKVVETVKLSGSEQFTRRAFAEKLEGIVSEGKVVLTGSPKVYQFKDVIKGNKIVLRENNEVVEVDDANSRFDLRK